MESPKSDDHWGGHLARSSYICVTRIYVYVEIQICICRLTHVYIDVYIYVCFFFFLCLSRQICVCVLSGLDTQIHFEAGTVHSRNLPPLPFLFQKKLRSLKLKDTSKNTLQKYKGAKRNTPPN